MKKVIFGFLFALVSTLSLAQSIPDFDAIKLETKEDFNASADDAALQAANYLFSTPLDKNNMDRLKSMQYIIKWASGTPDYMFEIDQQSIKFAKKDNDLLALYMAAMTKFVLENKADAKDQDKIKLNAVKLIVAYAKDEKNNVKRNSELKKAIAADDKGELAAYLKG